MLDCWHVKIIKCNPTCKTLDDYAQRTPTWEDLVELSIFLSRSGYHVIRSNEDFSVLGILGVLGDLGFSGKQRLHKSMQLGIEQGLSHDLDLRWEKAIATKSTMPEGSSFGEFGRPHAFTSEVCQRPVFTKRTSLRLVLWNWDSIYTESSERTRMFKGVLVNVFGTRWKIIEATGTQ